MSNKLNFTLLTMGSAALIASAGAMAGAPSSPATTLSAHTYAATGGVAGLSYAIDGSVGFDGNGELNAVGSQHAAMCAQAGFTCTLLDGSGDGMLQYKVSDSNGKSHVELIVGSNDGDGLFLSDTFVRFNGGTSLDSMANKLIIKDPTELAAAGTGFSMSNEWQRGDYQTNQGATAGGFFNANVSGGTGQDLNAIIDMNIGGIQTFHYDGVISENGAVTANAGALVDIQQGTTAGNTAHGGVAAVNAAYTSNTGDFATGTQAQKDALLQNELDDIQAMGVFHVRNQGGTNTSGPYQGLDYGLGAAVVTLDSQTLTVGATDGVSATYIHQAGFGFNGLASESYTADHADQRDFAYVSFDDKAGNTTGSGAPSGVIGTFVDPMMGTNVGTRLADTSQVTNGGVGVGALLVTTTTASNTVHSADFVSSQVGVGTGDPFSAGTGGNFTSANVTNLTSAWTTIFGSAP